MKIPDFRDIQYAHRVIQSKIHRTPVLSSRLINNIAGADLYFKCENFQKTGSFKIRGATYSVLSLSEEEKKNGVVAHSSGNHAQALAYAASSNNVKSFIVMPNNAPQVKIDAVKDYGGELIFCEPNIDARESETQKIIDNFGATLIHPYDYFNTICGQGTAAKELIEDSPDLNFLITPIGGGGLMSGSLISTKTLLPKCKVIGAEPEEVNDAYLSLKSGSIVKNKTTNTICDGLLTNLGVLNFEIIKSMIDDIILVSDDEVRKAQLLIMQRLKIIIEPSCATVLAVVLKNKELFANKKIGLILTGGNYDIKLSK
jgi:threonine dehydratase